jgi:hypothetical protein
MLNIHPVNVTSPLGTEGFDFFGSLLGLQADASQVPFQIAVPETTDPFGQDAALPMPAEKPVFQAPWNVPLAIQLDPALPVLAKSPESAPVPEAFGKRERALVPEALGKRESAGEILLRSDDLTPADVEQIVQSFWQTSMPEATQADAGPRLDGIWQDVRSVEVRPKEVESESLQHSLLRKLSVKSDLSPSKAPEKLASPEAPLVKSEVGSERADLVKPAPSEVRKQKGDISQSLELKPFEQGVPSVPSAESPEEAVKMSKTTEAKLAPIFTHIEDLAQQGGGKMTLQLDPPEMGRLTIEVTTQGKHVEVAIHAEHESTRSLLESGMGELQTALLSQDLQLTHSEVHRTSESSFSGLSFDSGQKEGGSFGQERGNSFSGREEKAWVRTLREESPVARYRNASRLDVRV